MRPPGPAPSRASASRARLALRVRPAVALGLDAACVLAFVAIGRASHHDGESVAGLGAWLGAAGLGMLLRVLAGQGTAPAFIGVALAFLGLFLLGWRAVAAAALPRS